MDAKEALRQEIAALKKLIEAREEALRNIQRAESSAGAATLRFYMWRPLDAIREVLREHGGKMTRQEIHDALVAGGLTKDRKRGSHNIRISIEKNIVLENLIAVNDEYVALPDSGE